MKLIFEFNTDAFDLSASHLARILLDIQHLAIVSIALAKETLEVDEIVFNPYFQSYKRMIETTGEDLKEAELTILSIKKESPLIVEAALKKLSDIAKKSTKEVFLFIINKILFVDLEREKRSLENQKLREEIIEKRINNASQVLNLAQKVPNNILREQLIASLTSSIMPFETEHPPIKSITIVDDKE